MAISPSRKSPAEWLRFLCRRPLCIICARPSEAEIIAKELQCEKNRVSNGQIAAVNKNHVFYYGSFALDNASLDFYITSSLHQGIQSFTIHASILFHVLKPRYAIHAGVCAGYADPNGKIKLKHVIFGEAALNCDEGKWVHVEQRGMVFQPDLDIIRLESCNMQSFADDPTGWRDKYHFGDFISTASVREDAKEKFTEVRSTMMRNAIGLDMEASAFLKLCKYMDIQSMGVIKGVSDFGDAAKGKDPAAYPEALRNTAKALEEWIRHSIRDIDWEPNEDGEPGVELSKGYYNNFVKVVLDCYGFGLAPRKTSKHSAETQSIPLDQVKGLRIVVPRNLDVTFFAEAGQMAQIIDKHRLDNVVIGNHVQHRNLYYKGGYLIDFPRTINSQVNHSDSVHQIYLFRRELQKQTYFNGESPLGIINTWEEFIDWIEQVNKEKRIDEMMESMKVDNTKPVVHQSTGVRDMFSLKRKETEPPPYPTANGMNHVSTQ